MDLIKVYDNALDRDTCELLIQAFDNQPNKNPGVTRGGVDPTIKNTTDFSLNLSALQNPEWQQLDGVLYSTLNRYLLKYVDDIIELDDQYTWDADINDTGFLIQKYGKNDGFYAYHNDFSVTIEENKIFYRQLVYLFYLNISEY
jgi:hypothetical protein